MIFNNSLKIRLPLGLLGLWDFCGTIAIREAVKHFTRKNCRHLKSVKSNSFRPSRHAACRTYGNGHSRHLGLATPSIPHPMPTAGARNGEKQRKGEGNVALSKTITYFCIKHFSRNERHTPSEGSPSPA